MGASSATAQGATPSTASRAAKFKGSSFGVRHTVNALGLDRSADLTWNPYAAATFSLSPSYALSSKLSLAANWDLSAEYTQRDAEASQLSAGDPSLSVVHGSVWAHQGSGLNLDGSASVRAGLSASSRAATRLGSLSLGTGLSRKFPEVKGLSLRWGLSATRYGHTSTHGRMAQSLYTGCTGPITVVGFASACAAEITTHSGGANSHTALSTNLRASYKLPYKLSARATVGGSWSWTYAADLVDPQISYAGPSGTSTRYLLLSDLRLSAAPHPRLGAAFGLSTAHPQLGADGTYRTPFINRYSNLYFDLTARY